MADNKDEVFLPEIEPEDIGWPSADREDDFMVNYFRQEADARYWLVGDEPDPDYYDDDFTYDY